MAICSGDTAWVLAATALVMIMTPGVGFFYGGLLRNKSVVSMMGLSFLAFAMVSIQWVLFGYSLAFKPSTMGMASGAIAGLVAITPASGYVDTTASIIIGGVAGVLCYAALLFRVSKGLDESCDAWSVHGTGGHWGAIATGIFASPAVNAAYSGLLYGNPHQLVVQIVAAGAAMIYAFVMTFALAKIVDVTLGLRVTEDEEYVGLDISQHGEKAYA